MKTIPRVLALLLCGACGGATSSPTESFYSAPYAANVVETTVSTSLTGGGTFTCTNTYAMTGTLALTIVNESGSVSGDAQVVGKQVEKTHSPDTCNAKGDLTTSWSSAVTGTTSDLHFDASRVSTNAGFNVTTTASFAGALTGGSVAGVLTFSESGSGSPNGITNVTQGYSASAQLVLTR
jgi:hypothetical protein